jgi:hypothetical protein
MDTNEVLAELRQELARVEAAILALQKVQEFEASRPKGKRGRKSMGPEERAAVSERMKRYWCARRDGAGKAEPAQQSATA